MDGLDKTIRFFRNELARLNEQKELWSLDDISSDRIFFRHGFWTTKSQWQTMSGVQKAFMLQDIVAEMAL